MAKKPISYNGGFIVSRPNRLDQFSVAGSVSQIPFVLEKEQIIHPIQEPPVAPPPYPIPDHYWTLDDANISGSTVFDTIGNLDGTDVGTTSIGGIKSEGRYFQSSNADNINLGNDALGVSGSFTIAMWVAPFNASVRFIGNRVGSLSSGYDGWLFSTGALINGGCHLYFTLEDNSVLEDSIVVSGTDEIYKLRINAAGPPGWGWVAATFDTTTGTKKVYLNRTKVHESTNASLIGANFSNNGYNDTLIGSALTTILNSIGSFEGRIDDIKFWDGQALSETDLYAAYDDDASGISLPSPTGYFSCDSTDISGSTLIDTIGGQNGTIVGSVTNISGGISGEGLNFTTGNDYVNLGFGAWDFTGSFTISFWFRNQTGGVSNKRFLQNRGTGAFGTQAGWMVRTPGGSNFEFAVDDGSGNYLEANTGSGIFDSNIAEWNHFVGTWDTTTGTKAIYLNGIKIQQEVSAALIGVDLTSGRESTIGISKVGTTLDQDYNGDMDEISWWDGIALTPEQVARVHQMAKAAIGLDTL